MKHLLLLCLLVAGILPVSAQKFWLTTYSFPGQPISGFTGTHDSVLLAANVDGIWRSGNQGHDWSLVLASDNAWNVYAKGDTLLAGGTGKIFYSTDEGFQWDSVSLGTSFPVRNIAFGPQTGIWAGTGAADTSLGLVGDGVYYSDGTLSTWQQRNSGFNAPPYIDQLNVDPYGRVYASLGSDVSSPATGLYFSDNQGLNWSKVNILVDGKGGFSNTITVNSCTSLAFHQDSVFYSIYAIAVNMLVQFNITKHRNDLLNNNFWTCQQYWMQSSYWWLDRPFHNLHFAANGDRYASTEGSVNTGGTQFLKAGSPSWYQHNFSLGYNMFGKFSTQFLYETSKGTLFMAQFMDFRTYVTDTSFHNGIAGEVENHALLYPNPGTSGKFYLQAPGKELQELHIFDISGREVSTVKPALNAATWEFELQLEPGTYFVVNKGTEGFSLPLVIQ